MNFIEALEEMKKGNIVKVKGGLDRLYKLDNTTLCFRQLYWTKWNISVAEFNAFIDVEFEIFEEPLLDDKEKEYLEAIIKPFKDKVKYIMKHTNKKGYEYICITYNELLDFDLIFPNFKENTMYKGMELHKKYTLKDLEL